MDDSELGWADESARRKWRNEFVSAKGGMKQSRSFSAISCWPLWKAYPQREWQGREIRRLNGICNPPQYFLSSTEHTRDTVVPVTGYVAAQYIWPQLQCSRCQTAIPWDWERCLGEITNAAQSNKFTQLLWMLWDFRFRNTGEDILKISAWYLLLSPTFIHTNALCLNTQSFIQH